MRLAPIWTLKEKEKFPPVLLLYGRAPAKAWGRSLLLAWEGHEQGLTGLGEFLGERVSVGSLGDLPSPG